MLNSLRKHTAGWAAKILIGLLVLAFASWGLNDLFNNSRNQPLITLADEKVTAQDFRYYERELGILYGIPLERIQASRRQVIPLLVTNRVVDVHARELNLGISSQVLDDDILNNRTFQDLTGKFNSQAFTRFMERFNISQNQYMDILKRGHIRNQLMSVVTNQVKAPKYLIEAKHKYDNEARVLKYVVLDKKAIKKIEAPSEETLKKYYEDNKARYKNPELRTVAYIELSAAKLKDTIKVDEKKVEAAYNSLKKRYSKPETRKLLQISFPDLKKAEEAHKKLTSGKKFEEVAKENGQKEKDIDLGVVTRKDILDKKIAEAAFTAKKGTFTKPIKGSLNTVIIQVVDVTPEKVTPLKDVAKELSDKLALEEASAKVTELQKTIEDDRGEGILLKNIAKKYGLQYKEVNISRNGTGDDGKIVEEFPNSGSLLKEIYESDIGIDNEVVTIRNTSVWFDVLKIIKERTKTFDEVKDEAQKQWIAQEEQKALDAKADELIAALKKGEKFDDVAKKSSLKVASSKALKRREKDKYITSSIVLKAFGLALNNYEKSPTAKGDGRIVFQVAEIKKAKDLDDKQRKALEASVAQNLTRDMYAQYLDGLRNQYNVKIFREAYQQQQ